MADIFDKLSLTEKRFDEINEKLMDPNIVNDQHAYRDLMRELKHLTPIIDKYREYKAAKDNLEEAKEMLSEGGLDKEFKEMVQEQ